MARICFPIIGLIFLSSISQANVSLKNGNFSVTYLDISYPGGFNPKIERVYNSKANYTGIFGPGWGSEYETSLTVSADGSVVVNEYGGGAENRFSPPSFKEADLHQAVEAIVSVAKAGLGNASSVASYKEKLKKDAMFRNQEWQKFVSAGKLKPRVLAVNTKLVSNRFTFQYITKTQDGYYRNYDNGRIEKFDEKGKLLQVLDKNQNFVKLSYDKGGKLTQLIDNLNRKMFFSYNNKGLLVKIEGENQKKVEYEYNSKNQLVKSKDVENEIYKYSYSNDDLNNMTKIEYQDNTEMAIAYYGREKNYSVKTLKSRDGLTTDYTYTHDPKSADHFSVSLVVKSKDKKDISRSSYEYFLAHKASGEEYTYRLVSEIDGEKTDTTYNECCGLPTFIKRGKETTKFTYDPKGRVTEKDTSGEVTKLKYHPGFGKVVEVQKYSKSRPKDIKWAQFQYDNRGNLILAKDSHKKTVRLTYDNQGRIKGLADQDNRQILFKYNENSKPVEITDPQMGTIKVTYNNSGEIKSVDSPAGRKIAVQVTSAFQNLLEIIRPAGVTLSF